MKVELKYGSLCKAKTPLLQEAAERAKGYSKTVPHKDYRVEVDATRMTLAEMEAMVPLLEEVEDGRSIRVIKALQAFQTGDFEKKIPSFPALPKGLRTFLQSNHKRGWLFFMVNGFMCPGAISNIRVRDANPRDKEDKPSCELTVEFWGPSTSYRGNNGDFSTQSRTWTWHPADVVHKSIPDLLVGYGIFIETDELLAEYDAHMDRFINDMAPRFSQQLVRASSRTSDDEELGPHGIRRVIHDLKPEDQKARPLATDSHVLDKEVFVPQHPFIYTFDLQGHTFSWAHVGELAPYEYDPSLREKLVLPRSHRDLLDVLTMDLSVFSGDIIRGKSAGNIIICKGLPGLGKTLTAEVYSELTETPIYSIHSGSLGTSPSSVEKALKMIFRRQRRWGCIVLLDEADVFVKSRGDDLVQNAIVAEFLRTLEYFEGLMFMTTNRPDDIDDAIVSRAAAIISYHAPEPEHRARIWEVMFAQNGVEPPKGLIAKLVPLFPEIAPRDIKMLLRLVLRVSTAKDINLTPDLFRRIAMFRAVEISDPPEVLDAREALL